MDDDDDDDNEEVPAVVALVDAVDGAPTDEMLVVGEDIACRAVHSLAVFSNNLLLDLYCAVISGISPSSAFGVAMSKRMCWRVVEMFMLGTQVPCGGIFNVSRQILPPVSMFG